MESSATPSPDQPNRSRTDLVRHARVVRYARPALIAGAVAAVVCIVLLVIIFLLDSFNATVYSVGGKDISDATDEARQIRELYSGARIGGVVFLVVSVLAAAASAVVLFLQRKNAPAADGEDEEDLGFDDLAGR
jgi:Mn2+/Fe2+ NRAMP family transporter